MNKKIFLDGLWEEHKDTYKYAPIDELKDKDILTITKIKIDGKNKYKVVYQDGKEIIFDLNSMRLIRLIVNKDVEKAIKDSVTFVEKILYSPIGFVKEKVEMFTETKDLYKKYTKLKETVEKTELYHAQIEELQKEVTELKSVLELNATLSEYTYINSTIVNRNIGYWYNTMTIDKGSKNGIEIGDAVIVNSGLIGKISSVSNFSITVKLLTSSEISNKISVKISSDKLSQYGLLIGYDSDC